MKLRVDPWLSFFLPGLGQLSQRRIVSCLAFFGSFAIAAALVRVSWVVPLIALASALETFRSPPPVLIDARLKTAYGVAGGLGFLCWFGIVAPYFLPLQTHNRLNADIDRLRAALSQCQKKGGDSIAVIACIKNHSGGVSDPWQNEYQLGFHDEFFEVRSWGRDGRAHTEDDLVYRTTVPGQNQLQ